jgi:hypothetical protein
MTLATLTVTCFWAVTDVFSLKYIGMKCRRVKNLRVAFIEVYYCFYRPMCFSHNISRERENGDPNPGCQCQNCSRQPAPVRIPRHHLSVTRPSQHVLSTYATFSNNQNNCTAPTQCFRVFCIILTIRSCNLRKHIPFVEMPSRKCIKCVI